MTTTASSEVDNERESHPMADAQNVVLVHGGFVDGSGWRGVYDLLTADGYHVSVVQNQTLSLESDVETTRNVLDLQDGPAILVGHSYGGAVITGAGHASNVVGLVYIAAFAPDEGESPNSILARTDPSPGVAALSPAFDDDFLWHSQEMFHDSFCQDLDDSESLIMATTQRPTARRCLEDHAGKPAWKTKPSWYQVSAQDRMIPPATERWMAKRIHARETIELDTSHASLATRPTEVLELITNAADAVYHALASH
jgi:pimeloyl-ACP methyl ester carboxylesterase